jgi:hypothetical protein
MFSGSIVLSLYNVAFERLCCSSKLGSWESGFQYEIRFWLFESIFSTRRAHILQNLVALATLLPSLSLVVPIGDVSDSRLLGPRPSGRSVVRIQDFKTSSFFLAEIISS